MGKMKKKIVKKTVKDPVTEQEMDTLEEVDDDEATELVPDDEKVTPEPPPMPGEEPVHPKLLNKPVQKAPPREKEKAKPVEKVGSCQCKDADCHWCHGKDHENDAQTIAISTPAVSQRAINNLCIYCVQFRFEKYFGIKPQPI